MGVVATLNKPEDVISYGAHPAHQEYARISDSCRESVSLMRNRVHTMREQLCDDTLAFDMEF